jgi:hypothetical protein
MKKTMVICLSLLLALMLLGCSSPSQEMLGWSGGSATPALPGYSVNHPKNRQFFGVVLFDESRKHWLHKAFLIMFPK